MRDIRRPKSCFLVAAGALLFWQGTPAGAAPVGQQSHAAACDRGAFRMIVDVGHTVQVPGAKSARGVGEYEFNLRLSKLIVAKLIERGFTNTTLLVTDGRKHKSLVQRVARANKMAPDLFLSIHHDAVPTHFCKNGSSTENSAAIAIGSRDTPFLFPQTTPISKPA